MDLDVKLEGDEPLVVAFALSRMIDGDRNSLHHGLHDKPPITKALREFLERRIATATEVLSALDKAGARNPANYHPAYAVEVGRAEV